MKDRRDNHVSIPRRTHHLLGRRARILGAVTAVVLAASGVLSPGAYAQDGGDPLPAISADMTQSVLFRNVWAPRNAVPATHRLLKAGSYGPAFQKPAAPRSGVQGRIVGGTAADPSAFPSVVGIESMFLA